jgi:hypothetical protein
LNSYFIYLFLFFDYFKILDRANENKVPPEHMPKKLFVISDMQFDKADENYATNFQVPSVLSFFFRLPSLTSIFFPPLLFFSPLSLVSFPLPLLSSPLSPPLPHLTCRSSSKGTKMLDMQCRKSFFGMWTVNMILMIN